MTSSLLLVVLPVLTLGFGRDEGCSEVVEVETTAQLQLKERRHSDSVLQKQSSLRSRLTVLDNSLYWQGYGSESLASYFIGFLGHDTVQVGGLNISAKVGLNLMGNALSGNFYQSVQADAAVLGLLPGCFTGGCSPAYYDDLLSTIAREGKIRRAFSLCFDDSPRGGGKLFLGRPEIPSDAVKIPLHPLTDGLRPYAPLSTFGPSGAGVEFFFGSKRVGSRSSEEWNRLMRSGAGYTDTGTPGLVLPSVLLDEILTELRRKILADEMCASMWGPYLPKFSAQHLEQLTVSSGAANCAMAHLEDFVVQLGPDVSLNISKSSFFYETAPCSKQLKISWTSSGNAETFIFGTAFNYGKTVLYDTSDLEAPKLILLGRANGCSANWAELATQSAPGQLLGLELPVASPIELQGLPWQVLGRDGTMTATLMIGSPPQEMTVQLDTGSQKLVGVHENCRNLGFCFLVQPENVTNTALLPGPDYGTAKCQQQVEVLTQMLSNVSSCSHLKSKLLCECTSQEECLWQIVRAASQVPSQSCASDRRTCGEKMDFHPEASGSFRPKPVALLGRGSSEPRAARSFLGSEVEKECERYRFCHVDSAGQVPALPESAGLAPENFGPSASSASGTSGADRDEVPSRVPPVVPRDNLGEVDPSTGSKQPKESVEDALLKASEKSDVGSWPEEKPQEGSSEKETSEAGEIDRTRQSSQKNRWEKMWKILKDSAQVASEDQNHTSSFDKAPETDQKEVKLESMTPSSEKSQWEPTSKDSKENEPPTVHADTGGNRSLDGPEPTDNSQGAEKDLGTMLPTSSREDEKWKPSVQDVLQRTDAYKRDSSVDAVPKEVDTTQKKEEVDRLSPTSSKEEEKSQWEPTSKDSKENEPPTVHADTGGDRSLDGPEPTDNSQGAEKDLGTMLPTSSKEDEKWKPSAQDVLQRTDAYKRDSSVDAVPKEVDTTQKKEEVDTLSPTSSKEEEKSQWEPTSNDSKENEPPTVHADTGGNRSLDGPEPKDKDRGTILKMNRMIHRRRWRSRSRSPTSSKEDEKRNPNVQDALQTADAYKRDSSADAVPKKVDTTQKEKEVDIDTRSPTSSKEEEKSQWEPTAKDSLPTAHLDNGGTRSLNGPEPKDMAGREKELGTMSPSSSKEDEKSPWSPLQSLSSLSPGQSLSPKEISLAPVSDFMDGVQPEPVIGEPRPLRRK